MIWSSQVRGRLSGVPRTSMGLGAQRQRAQKVRCTRVDVSPALLETAWDPSAARSFTVRGVVQHSRRAPAPAASLPAACGPGAEGARVGDRQGPQGAPIQLLAAALPLTAALVGPRLARPRILATPSHSSSFPPCLLSSPLPEASSALSTACSIVHQVRG